MNAAQRNNSLEVMAVTVGAAITVRSRGGYARIALCVGRHSDRRRGMREDFYCSEALAMEDLQ